MAKTFGSLFTGGGLADIGALHAGYELAWGVEMDPAIAAVASANLPHKDRVYVASVIGFDWARLRQVDHLHMSPPCQDFSNAKHHKSKDDLIRALNLAMDLASACIDAINYLHPNTVTLENVEKYRKPIVIDDVVYDPFNRIVDALWGLGYWVNSDVLNAADFGVPQTRRRLFLRAVKGGFPAPLPPPVRPWRGWYEAIEDLVPTLPESQFAEWQLARLPDELKTHLCHGTERQSPDFKGLPKAYLLSDMDADGKSSELRPKAGDRPAGTVMTRANKVRAVLVASNRDATQRDLTEPSTTIVCVGDGHSVAPRALLVESKNSNQQYRDGLRQAHEPHTTVITDHKPSHQPKVWTPSGRVVRMTPRALARFQTVPDWYELPQKTALACKIIGNGVPCLMMQRLLEVTQ